MSAILRKRWLGACAGGHRLSLSRGRHRPRRRLRQKAQGRETLKIGKGGDAVDAKAGELERVEVVDEAKRDNVELSKSGRHHERRRRGVRGGKGIGISVKGKKKHERSKAKEVPLKFISCSQGSGYDGRLATGLRSVIRGLENGDFQAVVLCGRGVPDVLSKVVSGYCKHSIASEKTEDNGIPLFRLVETSPAALGRIVGLPSISVLGIGRNIGPEYLVALDALK